MPLAGPVREQPHFVLGPKGSCHEGGPCGAKRGAPFAATRERTQRLADPVGGALVVSTSDHHDADQFGTLAAGNQNLPNCFSLEVFDHQRVR